MSKMINRAMSHKIACGVAFDVAPFVQPDGTYILPPNFYRESVDYCDSKKEAWVWSIGVDQSGVTRAALDGRYYMAEGINCIWLR